MPTNRSLTKLSRDASTEEIIVSEHLADLRVRVRFLTWVSGICWTLVVLLGGLLVTGGLDWLIHFDDSGTRLVFGLALIGGAGWMCWRHLILPLRQQLSSSFLASRVEGRFPGLKSRVVSAVEFLEHRIDSRLGSTELQKAVVGQAIKDLDRIETSDVIETKSIRYVTLAGCFVFVIAATVLVLHPVEAATSVQRLMFPFANVPWPRAVELQLVRSDLSPVIQAPDNPITIAQGDTLELYVENTRGRLPERVWFEYRMDDEESVMREPLRQTTLRDEKGRNHETAVINWTAVRGTMYFRASGGDDNVMAFHRVEVVPPPHIESLQVTVRPPAYSQRPVEVLPSGVGHVQGLVGTRVEITASSDKRLKSAKLRIGDMPPMPLELGPDEIRFTASFEIRDALANNYWFELTDTQGFTDREAVRYELRGIADSVPDVVIENPVADVLLTADAELPVKILAKDDLGLRDVRITYQIGDEESLRTIPLFSADAVVADAAQPEADKSSTQRPLGPQMRSEDYTWKIADLRPEPGTRIVFRAEATDDYDLGQPHVGKSVPRTITIVSRDDKQKELASRVGDLLNDLKVATQLQQRARQQTQELQTQLDKVGELRPQDVDQLQRTELDQRQTASRLTQPADGVEAQANQLLEELRANHLNDEGTEQRLERVANELRRLERDELPDAEQALTRAQKLAERQSRPDANQNPSSDPNENQQPGSTGNAKKKPSTETPKKGDRRKQSSNPAGEQSETASDKTDKDGETEATSPESENAGSNQDTQDKPASNHGKNDDQRKQKSPTKSSTENSQKGDRPNQSSNQKGEQSETASAKTDKDSETEKTSRESAHSGSNQDSEDKPTPDSEKNDDKRKQESQADRSDNKSADAKSLETALAEAHQQQTRSLETLQELQDSLSEWRDRRDMSRDLNSVIQEQQAIQKESAEMAQRTLTKSAAELTNQEKAELDKLASKQRKVAEQLEQFRKSLEQTADSLQKNDPDVAENLDDAKQELNRQETASKLQEAAQNIAENRMGSAAEAQQQALDELRDVERMMKRQGTDDIERFLKDTQDAMQEFQQIREQMQDIADRAGELGKQPDSPEKQEQMKDLMEQQEELTERMSKAERKLERLRLRGPAEASHRARKRLSEVMKHMLDADETDDGTQQAMDEIVDDLEQVERELALEKRIAQERLAFEQLEKIKDELTTLRARQETVIDETNRLQQARGEQDNLSRGQLRSLKELADTERSLQHSAEQMVQKMASAEVFSLVVKRLARTLGIAADRLGERDTSAATQTLEQDAIRKIDSLLAVLKEEQKKPEKQEPQEKPEELANEPQEREEKPEKAQPPGESVNQIAQLKLLKALQEEYLERTGLLEKFRDKDGKLPDAMEAEKIELAREQAELADYTRNLVAKYLQQQADRTEPEEEKRKPEDDAKPDPDKIDLGK